jgi:uncharacterized protein (DUF4415 family)
MAKRENIKRYSTDEILKMRSAGASLTDWVAIEQQSATALRQARASDPDSALPEQDDAVAASPAVTAVIGLDPDIHHWLCRHGSLSSQINIALREYIARHSEGT